MREIWTIVALAVIAGFPRIGLAQTGALRTTQTSHVLAEPRHEATMLGKVETGEVLEVLLEQGGWYLVRPLDDRGWRVAWVNEATVELMTLEVSSFTTRTRSPDPALVEDVVTARASVSRVMRAVNGATGGGRDEMWYRLDAGASGPYEISTTKTSFDIVLGLYDSDLSVIREHGGRGEEEPHIKAELAEGGYLIRVSGSDGATGTFTLEVTAPGDGSTQLVATQRPWSDAAIR